MKRTFAAKTGFALAIFIFGLCVPLSGRAGGLVAAWGFNSYGQTRQPNGLSNIKSIAAGYTHSLALKSDGSVVAWGSNFYNQSAIPPGLTNVIAIAAGYGHSLALQSDGKLVGWGESDYGQTNIPVGLESVRAIAAGVAHSVALKADGTVVSWGYLSTVPADLTNVAAIVAGAYHNLALKVDGTVVGWGYNYHGATDIPAQVTNVIAVAAGEYHNLALRVNGTVVGWGDNSSGQIDVPAGLSNVVAISAGWSHSLALRADGSVIGWGWNAWGQTNVPPGLSNVTTIAAGGFHNLALGPQGPPLIIHQPSGQSASPTSSTTFSVTVTGAEPLNFQWFRDDAAVTNGGRASGADSPSLTITNLQLADAATYTVVVGNAFGSVASAGATLVVITPPFIISQSEDRTIGAGTNVTLQASVNGSLPLNYQWFHDGAILPGRTNNTISLQNVQSDASGTYSLLVTNLYGTAQADIVLTVTNTAPGIQLQPFVRLPDQSVVTNLVVPIGGGATLMVSAGGSLPLSYQWRFNGADVPAATNATLALANLTLDQTGFYSVVIRNAFGETVSSKFFLNVVQVFVWSGDSRDIYAPTNIPSGPTNVVAVAGGDYHLLALTADGRVAAWGNHPSIAAATGVTNVPVSATNVSAIAAGSYNCMALRSNGTVVVWGNNSYGQTNVPTNVSNIMAIATGGSHCLAVRSNGTVTGWGNNSYSQATPPASLSNVVAIAAGGAHSLALKADGTVVAWGYNAYGQATVPQGLSNIIAIDAAGAISLALKSDGTAVAWGDPYGRIPASFSNLVATAVGYQRNVALKADGTIASWVSSQTPPSPMLSNVIAIASGERGTFSAAVIGDGSPFFTIHPISQNANKGGTITLRSRVVGSPPVNYQWQHEGDNIVGATNSDLTIANAQGKDTGSYQLTAFNTLGSKVSRTALLTIPFTTNLAASLNATNLVWESFMSTNKSPSWFAQNKVTHDGDAAAQSGPIAHNQRSYLIATISGPGTLSFLWKVSSEAGYDFLNFVLDDAANPLMSISGETDWQQKTIAIPPGTHYARWNYSKDGNVSAGQDAGWLDEVLLGPPAPVIVRQPFSRTVNAGMNVTIPAVASGMPPLFYQWLKNETNLPGATSQYLMLTNVTRQDSATYALAVSNIGGSVTSSNATLTVIAPLQLTAPVIMPDGSLTFSSHDAGGGWLSPDDVTNFEVQASSNLVDWITLPNGLILTNGSLLLRDADASRLPRRFYRISEH